MSVDKILNEAAKLYVERNAVYGDNYVRVGKALKALFPHGVELHSVEDHTRFQIFNLIIVKLSRYAVNWYEGHQDSIHDALVYSAILEAIDEEKKEAEMNFTKAKTNNVKEFRGG